MELILTCTFDFKTPKECNIIIIYNIHKYLPKAKHVAINIWCSLIVKWTYFSTRFLYNPVRI